MSLHPPHVLPLETIRPLPPPPEPPVCAPFPACAHAHLTLAAIAGQIQLDTLVVA